MLTGTQLKAARALLGLQRSKLAERMCLPTLIIRLAESSDGECPVTVARARQIQGYLERQGIEFLPVGSEPAARLMVGAIGA
ncbi:transcriptional regulator [Lichenibacterium dinghuense]|uniref:transcriptional regulator n=1 Tax=Lichenibacterium dinghuense TaxID=2895977 RepID=UPI001F15A76C|nr:transcriptional regulator [Lichenibacterium sp. 6Y81]